MNVQPPITKHVFYGTTSNAELNGKLWLGDSAGCISASYFYDLMGRQLCLTMPFTFCRSSLLNHVGRVVSFGSKEQMRGIAA